MIVLGLSEGYHDAGACLIEDGEILSATHAERLSRKKNDRWLHPKQKYLKNLAHKVSFFEKHIVINTMTNISNFFKFKWKRFFSSSDYIICQQ